jgi:hypothetical protein
VVLPLGLDPSPRQDTLAIARKVPIAESRFEEFFKWLGDQGGDHLPGITIAFIPISEKNITKKSTCNLFAGGFYRRRSILGNLFLRSWVTGVLNYTMQ